MFMLLGVNRVSAQQMETVTVEEQPETWLRHLQAANNDENYESQEIKKKKKKNPSLMTTAKIYR